MKYLIFAVMLLITFNGCNNKEKDQAELESMKQDSMRVADSVAQVEKQNEEARVRAERRKNMEKGDTFVAEGEAAINGKIKEGKIILLSETGEALPFKFEGSKIFAVSMPDGKMYQVEKDGDKVMLTVPGEGKMERRVVNGKIYLVDNDDQMFEVKVVNNKLIAVLDDGTEVNLAKK